MQNSYALYIPYNTFLLWLCSVRSAVAEAENDSNEDDFLSLRMKTKEEKVTIVTTNMICTPCMLCAAPWSVQCHIILLFTTFVMDT